MGDNTHTEKALGGFRVLDISTVYAAPFGASILADFGADVIKVELPKVGDNLRRMGTFYQGTSLWWLADNRNKRAITLDLRKPRGKELFKRLVAVSDVVIENFRPGTLEEWGLGYDDLKLVNPQIILARLTGFGQSGPYIERPGFAPIAEAMGGLRQLVGEADGAPLRPGPAFGDSLGGVMTALGILVSLLYREKTGKGQVIDTALYEAVTRFLEYTIPTYSLLGQVRGRMGNATPGTAPSNTYQSGDGKWVLLTAPNDRLFANLATAMGKPELATDPRFDINPHRTANVATLDKIIGDWMKEHTQEEAINTIRACDVPVTAIYDVADMFNDPHYQARETLVEIDDPTVGKVTLPGAFPRLSLTPGKVQRGGPKLGEHNEEVYCGLLGLSKDELAEMVAEGIV